MPTATQSQTPNAASTSNATSNATSNGSPGASQVPSQDRCTASSAAMECFRQYAKERPETVTLWALGIGFVIGWKLKPW